MQVISGDLRGRQLTVSRLPIHSALDIRTHHMTDNFIAGAVGHHHCSRSCGHSFPTSPPLSCVVAFLLVHFYQCHSSARNSPELGEWKGRRRKGHKMLTMRWGVNSRAATFGPKCYRACVLLPERACGHDTQSILSMLRQQRAKQQAACSDTSNVSHSVVAHVKEGGNENTKLPDLSQLIECCEDVCHKRPVSDLSADEWTDAALLLMSALARTGRRITGRRDQTTRSSTPEFEKEPNNVEVATTTLSVAPWEAALRLFIRIPSTEGNSEFKQKQRIALCDDLLRCLIYCCAPRIVTSGAFQSLQEALRQAASTSVDDSNDNRRERLAHSHVLYAGFLLRCASNENSSEAVVSLHKEALRVLLLEAPEGNLWLGVDGCLLTLEILGRMTAGELCWQRSEGEERKQGGASIDDVLWKRLDPTQNSDNVLTVARDCLYGVAQSTVSNAAFQEAFCRFFAVGMQLGGSDLRYFLQNEYVKGFSSVTTERRAEYNPALHTQVLQMIGEMLKGEAPYRAEVARVLEGPYILCRRDRRAYSKKHLHMPHVCVWFVQHVVRALFLHKSRARSAEGTRARHDSAKVHNDNNINRARFSSIGDGVNTESSSRAMREWQEATDASLQCLGRVLLHLPSARHGSLTHEEENMQKRARQKVYCLLFEGILEGVFSTTCGERSSKSASTCNIPPAMATLLQVYNETDWRYPSVAIFVKCLHAWGLHEMLRRVFYHVYRRERGQQPTYNGKKSNDGSVLNNGAGCAAKPKRYSLSLYTCELVIESACRARDPSTAALAVDYMLSQLLHLRSAAEQQPHEDGRSCGDDNNTAAVVTEDLIWGRCIAEWTRLIHEEIVPRVDEVFCQTGIDTKRQWMDDISEAKVAVASAVQ